jgi:hypothetical protein
LGSHRRDGRADYQAFRQFLELVCQFGQLLTQAAETFTLGQATQMRGPFAIVRRPVLYRIDDEFQNAWPLVGHCYPALTIPPPGNVTREGWFLCGSHCRSGVVTAQQRRARERFATFTFC